MKLLHRIVCLTRETVDEWKRSKPTLLSAAIAFYIIFSLGPILFIVIETVGLFFDKQIAEGQIVQEIHTIVGEKPAEVIRFAIERAESPTSTTVTTVFSVPLVLFGAAMIFFQLRNALNFIWGVEPRRGKGMRMILKTYLFPFFMVLFMGVLLLFLVIKSFALSMLSHFLNATIPFPVYILQPLDFFFTFAVITFLFAMIYKVLTEPKIRWSDEWIGAGVTSLLFTAAQFLMGLYFSRVDIDSMFGAIGSITLLLIWIYYSSLVFLFGAVFTKVYARKYGSFHVEQ